MELTLNNVINAVIMFITVGAWIIGIPSFVMSILGIIIFLTGDNDLYAPLLNQSRIKFWSKSFTICLTWIITVFLL